jgi:hypothetical protein
MKTANTEPDRPQDWHTGSQRQRMLAASLALLLTLLLVKMLAYAPAMQSRQLSADSLKQFINLRFIELTPPKELNTEPEAPPAVQLQKTPSQPALPKKFTPIAPTTLAATPAVPNRVNELPPDTLSTPLQVDSKAIRRAYQDSKTEIEIQAERSGKQLNDKPKTKFDRLESAVAAAAKPDCLGKDSGGAGLLAIPVALYLLAADKCK